MLHQADHAVSGLDIDAAPREVQHLARLDVAMSDYWTLITSHPHLHVPPAIPDMCPRVRARQGPHQPADGRARHPEVDQPVPRTALARVVRCDVWVLRHEA